MKIIVVANKTLSRGNGNIFDASYYNFYIPLLELGHKVFFWDTTLRYHPKPFDELVRSFKPDLILCVLAGDARIAPSEPICDIYEITQKGNIKTLNWFCDDTWRFSTFNERYCKMFSYCTTPEKKYIEKYKSIGYDNAILGNWHCNESLNLGRYSMNAIDVGFCGGLTESRSEVFEYLKSSNINISHYYGIAYEDIFRIYCSSKIVLNLTVNHNDPEKKRQMKLRIFEAVCAGALLITEYVDGLEDFFELGKEIISFETKEEAAEKIKYYLTYENENEREEIAKAGYQRFLKDHTSKIRLTKLLETIC